MREWEIGAVENIHGALPYIRFAPILALVDVGVNRLGKDHSYSAIPFDATDRAPAIEGFTEIAGHIDGTYLREAFGRLLSGS